MYFSVCPCTALARLHARGLTRASVRGSAHRSDAAVCLPACVCTFFSGNVCAWGESPGPGSLHLPGSLHCLRPLCFENCAGRDFNSLLNPSVPARKGGKQRHGQEVTCPSLGKPFGFSAWKGRGGSHPIVTGDSVAPPPGPTGKLLREGVGQRLEQKETRAGDLFAQPCTGRSRERDSREGKAWERNTLWATEFFFSTITAKLLLTSWNRGSQGKGDPSPLKTSYLWAGLRGVFAEA